MRHGVPREYVLLEGLLRSNKLKLIAIAGHLGSGKTTFARRLERELNLQRLTLDDFLDKKYHGPNIRNVNDEMDRLANFGLPVVIEGVGVLITLETLSYKYDFLVYMERQRRPGAKEFTDEFYAESTITEPATNLIRIYDDQERARQLADLIVTRPF